jgi:hypothetical protein
MADEENHDSESGWATLELAKAGRLPVAIQTPCERQILANNL